MVGVGLVEHQGDGSVVGSAINQSINQSIRVMVGSAIKGWGEQEESLED